jgi:uncharacterized membrane protein YoaT (DUF817 family)
MVPLTKLGAWFLLMIISYVMIAALNRPQPYAAARSAPHPQRQPVRI